MDSRLSIRDPAARENSWMMMNDDEAAERLKDKKIGSWLLRGSKEGGGEASYVSVLGPNDKVEHIPVGNRTWMDLIAQYGEEDNLHPYDAVHGPWAEEHEHKSNKPGKDRS